MTKIDQVAPHSKFKKFFPELVEIAKFSGGKSFDEIYVNRLTTEQKRIMKETIQLLKTSKTEEQDKMIKMVSAPQWFYVGLVAYKIGWAEDTLYFYRTSIRRDPTFYPPWHNLGKTLDDQRRHKEAEEVYRTALRSLPENIDLWYSLGKTLQNQKRFDEAEKVFLKVISFVPTDVELRAVLGSNYFHQKRYKEALKSFKLALQFCPPSSPFRPKILSQIEFLKHVLKGGEWGTIDRVRR